MSDDTHLLELFPSAEDVAARLAILDLGAPARALIDGRGCEDMLAVARMLRDAGMPADAVCVLGQALCRRAAVWWACRAAGLEPPGTSEQSSGVSDAERAALAAAESWVREPDAEKALAAKLAAERAGMASPSACAALAAFFAGESLAPPGAIQVPPPEHTAGVVAAGAVRLATVRNAPHDALETFSRVLDSGFAVASGQDRWNS